MKKVLFLVFIFIEFVHSAPFPATSTSLITDPTEGKFFSFHGFYFNTSKLPWTLVDDANTSLFESFKFAPIDSQKRGSAQLTLRKDTLGLNKNLQQYAVKWMKEYPQFGFEVLTTKNMILGGGEAFLIDFIHKGKGQQVRQIVLRKEKKVVIMTCSDEIQKFKSTVTDCNQMMTSFSWR